MLKKELMDTLRSVKTWVATVVLLETLCGCATLKSEKEIARKG